MICLIERFSILVDLIHEISLNLDNDNYYQTILALVLKILLSKPVEIEMRNYTYRSCVHNYYDLINGPYHLKTDSSRLGVGERTVTMISMVLMKQKLATMN